MTATQIAALVEVHRAAISRMSNACLAHEVARDAALPRSPLADEVRRVDDAEVERRKQAARITNALLALGRTSPEITANLTRLGFVGRRWASDNCPVFRYLRSLDLPVRSVDSMLVRLLDGGRVLVPDVIGTWMAEYDGYAYPALVEAVAA
ncbi:hypothetical protein ACFP2T_16290 [Plantactinospora solaniradicis]|uniref:Uncharacterized protein n=1 Tax=Plantactinospora solaniradicis TaxID=1723736 RepID=A0ABW1K971_9ACTN